MGKIILEFDSVEEAQEAKDALDGWRWKHAVWEIDQELRNTLKYDENLPEDVSRAYESLRDKIRGILYNNNLQME